MRSPAGDDASENSRDALLRAVDEVERATTRSTLCSALEELKAIELTPSPAFTDALRRIERAAIDHASIDVRVRAVAACRTLWVRALEGGAAVNSGKANRHDVVLRALNVITRRVRIEREEDIMAHLSDALSDLTPYIVSCEDVCAALEAVGAFARAEEVRAAVDIECVRVLSDRAIALNVTTVTKACEYAYFMLQGYAMRHRRQDMRVAGVMACGALARVDAMCCPESVVLEDYARAMLRVSVDPKPDVREACCASIAEHMKSRMTTGRMTFRAADAKLLYAMCVCAAADVTLTWYVDDINRAYAHVFGEHTGNVMMYAIDDVVKCMSDDVLRASETSSAREQCIKAMSVCVRRAGIKKHMKECVAAILHNVALLYDGKFFVDGARSCAEETLARQVLRDLFPTPISIKTWIEPVTRGLADLECARGYLYVCKDLLQLHSELKEKVYPQPINAADKRAQKQSKKYLRRTRRENREHLGVIASSIYDVCRKALAQTSSEPVFDLTDNIDVIEACVDLSFTKYVTLSHDAPEVSPGVVHARFVVLRLLCWAQTEDILDVPENHTSLNCVKMEFIKAELEQLFQDLSDSDGSNWHALLIRMYAALYKRHSESMTSVLSDMAKVGAMFDVSGAVDSSTLRRVWMSMRMFEVYIAQRIPEEAAKQLEPSFDALLVCLRWRPSEAATTIRIQAARLFKYIANTDALSAIFLIWLERRSKGEEEVADLALAILAEDAECPREIKESALAFVCAFARIDMYSERRARIIEACIERLSRGTDEDIRPGIASAVSDMILHDSFSRETMRRLLRKVFPHVDDDNPLVRDHVLKLFTKLEETPYGDDVAQMFKKSTTSPIVGCLSNLIHFTTKTKTRGRKNKPTEDKTTNTS